MWKQINLFTKYQGESLKTTCGGILSVLTITTIIILLIQELMISMQLEVTTQVDNFNLDERIRINLNITIHDITCFALSLDSQDVTGAHLEDMEFTIHKLRIRNGKFVNQNYAESVKHFEKSLYRSQWSSINEIDDCYGAQLYEGQKCITCQDVLLAYTSRDWPFPKRENIAQCKYSYIQTNGRRMLFTQEFGQEKRTQQFLSINDLSDMALTQGESCQIFGHFYIKEIPGNFHIGFHGKGQAVGLFGNEQQLSHTIHLLEFTPEKSQTTYGQYLKTTNPLDNTHHQLKYQQDAQYYLKVVETEYDTLFSDISLYSFTAYEQILPSSERLPQIIFKYEFNPITTIYRSKAHSFSQLLIIVLAVIGGVYSMSQFIHSISNRLGF